MCPLGISNPHDLNADLNLPCDSLIDESHSPITENVGIPGEMETSIRDIVVSVPEVKQEKSVATLGLEALPHTSLHQKGYAFEIRIISTKTSQ